LDISSYNEKSQPWFELRGNGVYLLTIVSDKKRHSVRIVKK
jgi:hypothetical protein